MKTATESTIDTITTYMVMRDGKLIMVTHRNLDPTFNGSSDYMLSQELLTATEPDKWIGEKVICQFRHARTKCEYVVYAKHQKQWDYSKPIGQRQIGEVRKSAKWDEYYKTYFKSK